MQQHACRGQNAAAAHRTLAESFRQILLVGLDAVPQQHSKAQWGEIASCRCRAEQAAANFLARWLAKTGH